MLFLELTNFLEIFFLKKCHFIEKERFKHVNPSDFGSLHSQIGAEVPTFRLHVA